MIYGVFCFSTHKTTIKVLLWGGYNKSRLHLVTEGISDMERQLRRYSPHF